MSCQSRANWPAKQPLVSSDIPSYQFKMAGADLISFYGLDYLLIADYWFLIHEVNQSTVSAEVIYCLEETFTKFEFCRVLRTDNVLQICHLGVLKCLQFL